MNEILQFDNFAIDALEVRKAVISNGFQEMKGPDNAIYTGISNLPVPHWFDIVSSLVGCKIVPKISCFRINYKGELPHSWVHSDDICAKYASVLYLNPEPHKSGTGFWKHKILGINRLPSEKEIIKSGQNVTQFQIKMTEDWKRKELWELYDFIPMKWNKFVTYPTCLFHSRYPFEGFGTTPEDGRLIWVCFYDKE